MSEIDKIKFDENGLAVDAGEITGFPKEVINRMLKEQVRIL